MKVACKLTDDAEWGMVSYIQPFIQEYVDKNPDESIVVFNGAHWIYNTEYREEYKDYKRRCLLALWSPCELFTPGHFHFDHYEYFTEVYCVCPFTCKFMNEYFGYEKFKYIPYPFTNGESLDFYNYDVEACWFGGIHGKGHIDGISVISNGRPYKFITSGGNRLLQHEFYNTKVTHLGLSTQDKLREVSKSRASLSYNLLYLNPSCANNGKLGSLENRAFDHFDHGVMPQFKVRTHEIASCKSLLLVQYDAWNLVEDFYTKDEDFLYFNTPQELNDILEQIKKEPLKYKNITESAYTKQKKYTIEKIMDYIRLDDDSLITWSLKNVQK